MLGAITLACLAALLAALLTPARPVSAQSGTPAAKGMTVASADCQAGQAADQPAVRPFVSDYVILIDVSGSMVGLGSDPDAKDIFSDVKASAIQFVQGLPDAAGANLVVVPFAGGVNDADIRHFGLGSVLGPDGDKAAAIDYIQGLSAPGEMTYITDSIKVALSQLGQLIGQDDTAHAQTILLYTDGIGNGPDDSAANNEPTFDNAAAAIREYKNQHPRLFGYYVALGVDLPNTKPLEDVGIRVVSSSRDAVPNVRQVELAMVGSDLGTVRPGASAANRLCAVGNAGEPVAVSVTLDPTSLPDGLGLSLATTGGTLGPDGLALDWALGDAPDDLAGSHQTARVQVSTADDGVILVPGLLDVGFTVAPLVTLEQPVLTTQSVARQPAPTEPVAWDAPIAYDLGPGGRLTLSADLSRAAAKFPNASAGFKIGAAGAVAPTLTLTENGKDAYLHVELPAADALALADGDQAIPFDLKADAGDGTLRAAQAQQASAGTGTIGMAAPFTMLVAPTPVPTPTLTVVSVAPMPPATKTISLKSAGDLAWTEPTVVYEVANGATGTLKLQTEQLTFTFPNATAKFVAPDGTAGDSVDLSQGSGTMQIEIRVPAADAEALGVGPHATTLRLVVDPNGAAFSAGQIPFQPGPNGTQVLAIPVVVVVTATPQIVCKTPSLQLQAPTAATAGSVDWSGALDCPTVPAGVTVAATTESPSVAGGALAFVADDGQHADASLSSGGTRAGLVFSVPESAFRNGGATTGLTGAVTVTSSDPEADVVVDGKTLAGPGPHRIAFTVAAPPMVAVAAGTDAGEQRVSDADDPAKVVVWRLPLTVTLRNGAVADVSATVAGDAPKLEHAVAGISVAGGPPQASQHVDQPKDLSLVVQAPAGELVATGADSVPVCADLVVAPGPAGALVDWPQGSANPDGSSGLRVCGAAVAQPSVEVTVGELAPVALDPSDRGWSAATFPPVPVTVVERHGARATVSASVGGFPGATADVANGPDGTQLNVVVPRTGIGKAAEQTVPVTLKVDAPGAAVRINDGPSAAEAASVGLKGELAVTAPQVSLTACKQFDPYPASVKSNDEKDTSPVEVTCEIQLDAKGGGSPALTGITTPGLKYGEEALAPTKSGFRVPDDATLLPRVTLTKDQPKTVAVLQFDRQAARKLGIGTYTATVSIAVDPEGACVFSSGSKDCTSEPFALKTPDGSDLKNSAKVYEPICWTCIALKVGGGLAALLAGILAYKALPGMPKNARLTLDATGQTFDLTTNPAGVGSYPVDLGLGQDIVFLKGGPFKHVTASLPPEADASWPKVSVDGADLQPGDKPVRLGEDSMLMVDGQQLTFSTKPPDGDGFADGFGDGN